MPLSEEEQRLLEQLEHALAADDPNLASALRGSKFRARARRNAMVAVVGFVAGLALLMVGVIVTQTVLGVAGFVLMLGSAYVFLSAWRARGDAAPDVAARTTPRGRGGGGRSTAGSGSGSGSFMHRMEERWKRRRDTDL